MIRLRTLPTRSQMLIAAIVLALLALVATTVLPRARSAESLPALDVAADNAAAAPGAMDPAKLFSARANTVVSIDSVINGEAVEGAGVIVDGNGRIVTASHVVQSYEQSARASSITVRTYAGDELAARLIAIDQFNDLAILDVDERQVRELVAAPLANSDRVVVGAPVAAIGSPYGNDWTQTLGSISGVHRVVDSRINAAWQIPDALQFDAAINKGNSGGPLFNARGEVIGIVQQIQTPTGASAGVAFAVSSNIVTRALQRADVEQQIQYAWLGLEGRTLTPQLASHVGVASTRGVLVQQATGPAERAGVSTGSKSTTWMGSSLHVGDIVTQLGDTAIESSEDLQRVSAMLPLDEPVSVIVNRGGETVNLQIVPTSRQLVTAAS